jgi:pimeloyl-ACP methyl ester carboxylesterase
MSDHRHRRLMAGVAGLSALAAASAVEQRRHMRRIAADPAGAHLQDPPRGRPLRTTSSDGTLLYGEIFGPDDGETVVLLHGWTEMLTFWIYVIEELTSRGRRVVSVDLRGHGESQPASAGEYALARFGDDLEAMLEASVPEGRRAVVAGHSLGAMAIAAWAEHYDVERRAQGAALINTGLGDLLAEQLLLPVPAIARTVSDAIAVRGLLGSRAPLPRLSTPASYAAVRYSAFGPAATPAQVAFYERMLWTCPPRVRADVGLALSEVDLFHAVDGLTVPTIVVAGDRDRLTPPSHAERIAAALPNCARLIVLENTGHMGPLERPQEISDAIAGLGAPAPAGATRAVD